MLVVSTYEQFILVSTWKDLSTCCPSLNGVIAIPAAPEAVTMTDCVGWISKPASSCASFKDRSLNPLSTSESYMQPTLPVHVSLKTNSPCCRITPPASSNPLLATIHDVPSDCGTPVRIFSAWLLLAPKKKLPDGSCSCQYCVLSDVSVQASLSNRADPCSASANPKTLCLRGYAPVKPSPMKKSSWLFPASC